MNSPELYNESNQATYAPEDDKLRLYVGRVPRDEYEALRAEGWTSTPKQDCDFVAVWAPEREDTALSYAGEIMDEDMSPQERAADRAERFAGYRDGNLSKAEASADRYDQTPAAHGRQSYAAACRAADRHDRHAGRAVNAWDKAEYWTSRTAGVIGHALHLSSPGVRMGRIKTLEAELRKAEASHVESVTLAQLRYDAVLSVVEHADGTRDKLRPTGRRDFLWALSNIRKAEQTPDDQPAPAEQLRRAVLVAALDTWRNSDANRAKAKEAEEGTRPAADIARDWLEGKTRPADWNAEEGTRTTRHLRLRIAYEWQMLNAQGGRESITDMEKGGTFKGATIAKVNKSTATGRVVSVAVIVPHVGDRWTYKTTNEPGTPYALATFDTERAAPGSYQPPTPESLAKLAEFETARRAALAAHKAKVPPCPLINPTDADAERLQDAFNAADRTRWEREHKCSLDTAPGYFTRPTPGEIVRMTQAQYSAASKGSYARHETRDIFGGADGTTIHGYGPNATEARRLRGHPLAKVRATGYQPLQVVLITDKPQKALPAAVWQAPAPLPAPVSDTVTA